VKGLFIGLDPQTLEMVTLALRLRWPDARALVATEARRGLDMVETENPDLVLMQPNFSDMSLSGAIKELRLFSDLPLIVYGQEESGEMEAVSALELGADDYIRPPCGFMELVARVVALLRRMQYANGAQGDPPVFSGRLILNPSTYEVFLDSKRLALTPTEFRLLHILIKNRSTVVSHRFLERLLWEDRYDSASLVKKYVQRLRKKLGDDPRSPEWIASVHGVGYRFVGPADSINSDTMSLALERR